MDVTQKNCRRDSNSSEDVRCFTCLTKSNLLYLTAYPHSREGSLREKSPTPGGGRICEKQNEAADCAKCKYYVDFISNLMDGIICDELQESKRKDGIHDCCARPELDSQQKIKIVQKLYILFSDAQVAALGGRFKRHKTSCCSEEKSSENIIQEESCEERDPCEDAETETPSYLEVIPELESRCGSANSKFTQSENSAQKTKLFKSKDNKVAVKRKTYNPGMTHKSCSPATDQRRRSSGCPSFGSQKSKNTSLSGCSCRTAKGSVASSDSRNIHQHSVKNGRSVENERFQQSCFKPIKKLSGGRTSPVGISGRNKCPTAPPKSNSLNCGMKNKSTKYTPRSTRHESFQKSRSPKYLSASGKKCSGRLSATREIERCQSASKLKCESFDELVSEESNLNLVGVPKSFVYHTNSNGKCTSLVIGGSKNQPPVLDGSHNIRIDFERLKKRHGRK